MNLLIITQTVDSKNPELGFFHVWLESFAKTPYYDNIHVICLREGEHNLPSNIHIHSLGKERGVKRLGFIKNFLMLLWKLRKEYQTVLVHMNQEYMFLGALQWYFGDKKIYFWRNHYQGNILTDAAIWISHETYYTSEYSYNAHKRNAVQMPVGIDTSLFVPMSSGSAIVELNNVLFLGRIAPSKNPKLLLEALSNIKNFSASFYGPGEQSYVDGLKATAKLLSIGPKVKFNGSVSYRDTPPIYNAHTLYVNLSRSGMLDKTIFEAMACGSLVLVCNKDLKGILPDLFIFEEGNVVDLRMKIEDILALSPADKRKYSKMMRDFVLTRHSLDALNNNLIRRMAYITASTESIFGLVTYLPLLVLLAVPVILLALMLWFFVRF